MRLRQLLNILNRHPVFFLSIGIIAYILVFSGLSFWKYDNFLYNALDLGIYTQVFESFRAGNHWYSSIQQSSYLGDHFEPFILALLPFYLLIPHPKTLLVLQIIFLAIPAIPIFFIAREVFYPHLASPLARGRNGGDLQNQTPNLWALGVSFFYLLNPLVHNINLFEFHLLPFSLIFLFTAAYFYITTSPSPSLVRRGAGRYFLFLLFCFLALLAREDIPLIVFMFGILALIDKRRWYWVVTPMILAGWWFILSMGIISSFNIGGSYKFLSYYSWAFEANPFQFITHIFGKAGNWEMALGFFFAFLFLPLFRPRFLILALPIFLQFTLLDSGATGVVWQIHYAAFFLPALFLSGIFGIKKIFIDKDFSTQKFERFKVFHFFSPIIKDKQLIKFIFTLSVFGVIIVFGPLSAIIPFLNTSNALTRTSGKEEIKAQKALIRSIPPDASILSSSEYLSLKQINQNASALFYFFNGVKQYSSVPYIPAFDTKYIVINGEELLELPLTYGSQAGAGHIREFLKDRDLVLNDFVDNFALFSPISLSRNNNENINNVNKTLYKFHDLLPEEGDIRLNNKEIDQVGRLKLIAYTRPKFSEISFGPDKSIFSVASFSLFWKRNIKDDSMYAIELILSDQKNKTVVRKTYPIAHGLYPVSDWEDGKIIETYQRILLPDNLRGSYGISMRLVDASNGSIVLNSMRTIVLAISSKIIGEMVHIGSITAH